jgi:hypothetical protein
VEKRELVAGNFITFDKTVAGKLKINGDPGGGFGGGLLKFNVVTLNAASFELKPSGRYRLKLGGGSYFRITATPGGTPIVDELQDITAGGDYGEGSLILIESDILPAGDDVKLERGGVGMGVAGVPFELSTASVTLNKLDAMVFIRTGSQWLEISRQLH